MARKVKCLKCLKEGTNDTYYKAVIKGKNRYFCNEFEYMQYLEDEEKKIQIKEERNQLITWIVEEFYDYEVGMVFPLTLSKRLNPLFNFYPIPVIKEAFEANSELLYWAVKNKDFQNEFSKTCYIMHVIDSNINDVYNRYKNEEKKKIREESKSEMIIDTSLFEEVNVVTVKNKNKDISRFLEE